MQTLYKFSVEAIHQYVFRPLTRYTFRLGAAVVTITAHWWRVSSFKCSFSSTSRKTFSLLIGPFCEKLICYVGQSLPLQKTTFTLTLLESLFSQPKQESSISAILFFFLWIRHVSSLGTVSSIIVTFELLEDQRTMLVLRLVGTIYGNCSFFSKSSSSCLFLVEFNVPGVFCLLFIHSSPPFTNWIFICLFLVCFASFLCFFLSFHQIPDVLDCVAMYIFPVLERYNILKVHVVGFLFSHTRDNLGVLKGSTCADLCIGVGNTIHWS